MLVNKTVPSEQTDRGRYLLDIDHPSFIAEVETAVKLAQLILQIIHCNINMDPQKTRFSAVVVDCN
ncbi:hypothetical protein A2U01_0095931 [Trifolium medium]|uniref:Uncharacterized protein n=1 Tax=Trifolium medium TaxID=97028 RepID=A0A392UPJ3_9FABA|nr:hypothetical protein [Trifolium medium]